MNNKNRYKFRIWFREGKELLEEDISFKDGEPGFYVCDPEKNITVFKKLGNDVLQQCTGVKDKNGKLIYEGDILLNEKTQSLRMVGWFPEIGFNIAGLDKYVIISNFYEGMKIKKG